MLVIVPEERMSALSKDSPMSNALQHTLHLARMERASFVNVHEYVCIEINKPKIKKRAARIEKRIIYRVSRKKKF